MKTVELRGDVEIDAFVIMPNHIHAIIILNIECECGYVTRNGHGTPCPYENK